jgi:hypothetical protein
MSYPLRMHREVRDWLTGLRDTEPELARQAGEAVLALLDAGSTLGPPLVVPLESLLRRPEDPRHALDCSYQRQLEFLTKVRRGVADVATSRKRLELQMAALESQATKLAAHREAALAEGREDLAAVARDRDAMVQDQLSGLRRQHDTLAAEEQKLTAASQRLQTKVEAFRMRKETAKATYTAEEASQRIREAFAEMAAESGDDPEVNDADHTTSIAFGATAEAEGLEQEIRDSTPGAAEAGGTDDVAAPPGMMLLRPGAPDDVRSGLLFAMESGDTVVLLAQVDDTAPGGYAAAIPTAVARMPGGAAGAAAGDVAGGAAGAFLPYSAESFLDEFFPGAETEVEIAAAALVARSRAHTLAEARQRMRMTQAQVAERMNVRQERVSAIERAEPGATEVRTLTAYVRALGGRLEIVAHIDGERIVLG